MFPVALALALSAVPAPPVEPSPRSGPLLLITQHGALGGATIPRRAYVPGLAFDWVFAPRPHLAVGVGTSLDYVRQTGVRSVSVRDCADPCTTWTRDHLRVHAEMRIGPAWRWGWMHLRTRVGYAHHFVRDPSGVTRPADHPGWTASASAVASWFIGPGFVLGFEIGGGTVSYPGRFTAGLLDLGGHLGWMF